MQTTLPPMLLRVLYQQAADDYLRALKLENIMESTPQATQRKITVESLDLVTARRPEVHVYNELLVQYQRPDEKYPGQVVPDNMVVLSEQPLSVKGSFAIPFQPVRPFWVLEYVSQGSRRKDWTENMVKYEHELQVPYYLIFEPDIQELILNRHNGTRYVTVLPNDHGRYAIPDLDLELALLDGWVRYWFRGELLALPPELLRELEQTREQLNDTRERLKEESRLRELADKRTQDEIRLRELADKRTQDEIRLRELADKKTQDEMRLRKLAESQALEEKRLRASLEAQLALLQSQLKDAGKSSPDSP